MIPRRASSEAGARCNPTTGANNNVRQPCTTVTTVPDSVLPRTIVTREIGATNTSLRKPNSRSHMMVTPWNMPPKSTAMAIAPAKTKC